jgi:hypothetical protein
MPGPTASYLSSLPQGTNFVGNLANNQLLLIFLLYAQCCIQPLLINQMPVFAGV